MKVRGVSPQNLAEKKNGLREPTRNLVEFSPRKFAFENFCSRSEREKSFFLGLISMCGLQVTFKRTNLVAAQILIKWSGT